MRTVPLVKASESLGKYAKGLKREIVVVMKGKRALAALVPLGKSDQESIALSMHPEFLGLVKKARAELAAGRKLSLVEMRRRVLPPRGKTPISRLQRKVRRRRR